jgi:lipopolysaccharide exporter
LTGTTSRIVRGAGWVYAYRWIDRLLAFASVVVVARLLSPADFGLFAIAASYVAIIEGLAEFDVNSALIRTRDQHRDLYDSAWTLSVARGLVSSLAMVAVAPFLADPRIAAALYVLALAPLLTGLSNPRFVMFERDLDYSKLAVLTIVARLVSLAATLVVAVVFTSYWALVCGLLAGSATNLVLTYVLKPYRPRFSRARFADIFSFSGWMSLSTIVTTLSMQTDRIIVGRLLGIAEAGSYHMTQAVGVVPTAELAGPIRRVLFPSFSSMVGDLPRLRRGVCESIGILGSLGLPAGVGFAFAANDFVPLILGNQWVGIIPLLQVLVPFLAFRATLSMTLPCVMALGRTRLLFVVVSVYALVHLPIFIAGTAFYGLPGAIWSIVAAGFFYSYLNALMLKLTLDIPLREIAVQLRRPAFAVAAICGVLAIAANTPLIDITSTRGSWLSLVMKIAIGATVFCAAHYAIWRYEGRPAGIESRLRQVLAERGARGSAAGDDRTP